MPLNFPTSPAVNEQYTFGGNTWVWNGSAWNSYNPEFTTYVSTLNGFTGGVTLSAGTGITLTNTSKIITITNIGVTGFNGLIGNVSGVTAVNAGTGISITGTTNPIVTNTGVQSFNGATGAVSGVNSVNGLTGALTISGGTGMSVLSGGRGITLVNTGVLSVNGSTGAITNVARTNVDNFFSESQTISAVGALFSVTDSLNAFELDPGSRRITSYNDITGTNTWLQFSHDFADRTVTLPTADTTLAGLAVPQTFTANQTFSTVGTFNAGITASGLTLNGPLVTSRVGTFNAGITTSGVTLNGTIIASGLGTFNSGITAAGGTFTNDIYIINTSNNTSVKVTTNARNWFL